MEQIKVVFVVESSHRINEAVESAQKIHEKYPDAVVSVRVMM